MQQTCELYPPSIQCYLCGGECPRVHKPRAVPVGARTVVIDDEFYHCSACDESVYLGDMADAAFRRVAAQVRVEDGLLAPDDIVALRGKYGLTQAELERLIGAGEKTVVRWERGTVAQNRTADTLLRVLSAHPEVFAQLAAERGVKPRSRKRAAAAKPRRKGRTPAPSASPRADAA